MKKVLFLGNGINRLGNEFSWEDLIVSLQRSIEEPGVFSEQVPFPMRFEYLYLVGNEKYKYDEQYLIDEVINGIKKIKTTPIHDLLENTTYTDIITTNYDYLIEDSLGKRGQGFSFYKTEYADQDETLDAKSKKLNKNREKRYRLYTKNECFGTNVWHIHGEVDYPKTMVLGYEYYLAVVGKIQDHINNMNKKDAKKSWIDLLLSENVDFIGYQLDYSESTIWFVLNYRAREIAEGKIGKNKIAYHVLSQNMDSSKRSILSAYYIDVVEYNTDSYKSMYTEFFRKHN
ncbi:MAG: SIR2 family protein [Acholeplasmataceae bacterium]|nr:SIR2 family protein [Acholeplasmataceae bacterium]